MPDFLTLKKSDCKNCYKCIRYCPVKAIRFSGNQAHIIGGECILCGKCFSVCPQHAKRIIGDAAKVKVMIESGSNVVASLDPSFIANYKNVGIEEMRNALKKLGFFDAEEAAVGATIVKNEYERMIAEDGRDIIITSNCPSVNLLIQKHYPEAIEYLADVISPMEAHCRDIKARVPNAKTVFIGPCIANKAELKGSNGAVDAILTFKELTEWLDSEGIALEHGNCRKIEKSRAAIFPVVGGVIESMLQKNAEYAYIAIDGVEKCISALNEINQGRIDKCFIEMSACVGSCIGGPCMDTGEDNIIGGYLSITEYAGKEDYDTVRPETSDLKKIFNPKKSSLKMPTAEEIREILKQMDKSEPEHELNCGSCGYNSCREKAIAIYQGKAEISMCLPFLKERTESYSNAIVNNTPNGLILLNDILEVQQINAAALKIVDLKSASDIIGEPIDNILDPAVFKNVRNSGKGIFNQHVYLKEYNKYIEQTVVRDKDTHMLVCIMRDITEEEKEREKQENINRQTVEVADRVVEKQMRIVQEIASLLGETAAETKIALAKLKKSISDD